MNNSKPRAGLLSFAMIALLATAPAPAQTNADLSSLQLNNPKYANYLNAGRHELVQIDGAAGLAYGYGVFMRGFGRCPQLKTTNIPFTRIYSIVEKKFWLDVVGLDDKAVNLEDIFGPVLLTAQWMIFVRGGISDIDTVIANYGCGDVRTRRIFAEAEKLTVKLLSTDVGMDGVTAYRRPLTLAGLPEETQKLYDEYYLCKLRTGQTDHLGSFGPCDEALFQFKVSQAKATRQPPPTREDAGSWISAKGPVGQVKERSYGTDVIFRDAPRNFTPDIPDTSTIKMPLYIKLQYNEGKRNQLWKVNLSRFGPGGVYGKSYAYYRGAAQNMIYRDYSDIGKAGNDTLLECLYYDDGRTNNAVFYWYKKRPEAADPAKLKSHMRNHPVLLVMDPVEECPPAFTSEIYRQRQALFDKYL